MLGAGRRPTNHPRGVAGQRDRDWSCANRVFATHGAGLRIDGHESAALVRDPDAAPTRRHVSWGIAHRNCRRDRVSGGIDAGEGAVERVDDPHSVGADRDRPSATAQADSCLGAAATGVDPKGTVRERRGHPERSEAHRHTARRCGQGQPPAGHPAAVVERGPRRRGVNRRPRPHRHRRRDRSGGRPHGPSGPHDPRSARSWRRCRVSVGDPDRARSRRDRCRRVADLHRLIHLTGLRVDAVTVPSAPSVTQIRPAPVVIAPG